MLGYYDAVLGLIPVTFLGLAGALQGAGFAFTIAVPLAALAAATIVGHAMFVNAPVDSTSRPAPGVSAE